MDPAFPRRAPFLPECTEEQAACRGLYFRPTSNDTSWQCAEQPLDDAWYRTVRRREADYGCQGE